MTRMNGGLNGPLADNGEKTPRTKIWRGFLLEAGLVMQSFFLLHGRYDVFLIVDRLPT